MVLRRRQKDLSNYNVKVDYVKRKEKALGGL